MPFRYLALWYVELPLYIHCLGTTAVWMGVAKRHDWGMRDPNLGSHSDVGLMSTYWL